jgi:hypothetical protein
MVLLLVSSSGSKAAIGLDKCNVYVTGKSEIPDGLKRRMAHEGDSAVRACQTPSGGLTEYVSLSPIWIGQIGVCEFSATPEGQKPVRPTVSMAVARPCPPQDSSRYIATSGISEGLFLKLVGLWDRVSLSPTEFKTAFSTVDKSPLADQNVRRLQEQTFARSKAHRPALTEIYLSPMTANLADEKYDLILSDPDDSSKHWSVYVDLTATGIAVLRVESMSL